MLYILIHYVFAMQYLKASINLPIIMDIFALETQARLDRSKKIIRCFHICFISTLIIWLAM